MISRFFGFEATYRIPLIPGPSAPAVDINEMYPFGIGFIVKKSMSDQIHIHCIYNARVTAFMTRYIRDVSGGDLAAMLVTMDGIWRPGGVWASFLGDAKNSDQPNRYKGYEYD